MLNASYFGQFFRVDVDYVQLQSDGNLDLGHVLVGVQQALRHCRREGLHLALGPVIAGQIL